MKYTGVRVENISDKEEMIKRLSHNMRRKKDQRIKNSNGIVYFNGQKEVKENGINSEYSKKHYEYFKNDGYDKIREEHKKLSKDFRKDRHKSLNEGVLYFSNGINEDYRNNLEEFNKKLQLFLKSIEEEYNTKILNFQIHLDEVETLEDGTEQGNIHIHFMFLNFDKKTGKVLNLTRSKKNGGRLQDLAAEQFSDFGQGYQRGITKEKPRKYLNIEEYKEYQDTMKENETLKEENKSLKTEQEQLKKEINDKTSNLEKLKQLISQNQEKEKKYQRLLNQIRTELEELDNIDPENSEDLVSKLWKWFDRSYKKEEKAKKTLESIYNKIKKTNQTNQKQMNNPRK